MLYNNLYTRDLLRLNVGRNSLSEIPKSSLEILKNLNHLDLSFNKIRDVKEKNFVGEDFVFLTLIINLSTLPVRNGEA